MTEPIFFPPGAPELQFHPFANLFPLLGDDELRELADDIKLHGQRETGITHRGFVLDGRNRYRAALLAGIGFSARAFEGSDRDALDLVISLNLKRRHLTPSQRAMIWRVISGDSNPSAPRDAQMRSASRRSSRPSCRCNMSAWSDQRASNCGRAVPKISQ